MSWRSGRSDRVARVAVVTGASSGVGRQVARELGRRGYRVGLIARGTDGLEAAAAEIAELGSQAIPLPTDVADPEAVEAAADRAESELGPIELWVNDAMATVFAPFAEIEPDEFRRASEVTYLGTVWGTRAALRRMRPRNQGAIVQVGSALAHRGIPLQAPYCGAKHAILGFTESVRSELSHDGSPIRISMVQLPAVNTPQFDVGRSKLPRRPQPVPPIFAPEVAARAVVWAAEHPRVELFVGWPVVKAVWGNRLAPRFADWYLGRNGYESQQTPEPADPRRADNLFTPVPGDHGADGRFSDRSRKRSLPATLIRHRLLTGGVIATAAVAGTGIARLAVPRH